MTLLGYALTAISALALGYVLGRSKRDVARLLDSARLAEAFRRRAE